MRQSIMDSANGRDGLPAPKRQKIAGDAENEINKSLDDLEPITAQWTKRSRGSPIKLPDPLPVSRFYSAQSPEDKKRLKQLQDIGQSAIRTRSLRHIFKKQDAACAFADAQPTSSDTDALEVFSFEKIGSTNGGRMFVAASYRDFWKVYKHLPPDARHFYEVIRENRPCCLYFDIEFSRAANSTLDGELVMKTLLSAVHEELKSQFDLEVHEKDIIDLEASSDVKFSRHIVIRSSVFKNNIHAGFFVRQLMIRLYSESLGSGGDRYSSLFVSNEKGQRVSVVDLAVYSRNRNFRLFLSTKVGKSRPLIRAPSCKCDATSEKEFFFASLICRITTNHAPLLECDPSSSTVPGDVFSLSGSGATRSSIIKRGDTFQGSVFPELDAWIAKEVRKRPGAQEGYLRSWIFYQSSGLLVYSIGGNRFCENIDREHKSNHVMIAVDFKSCTWQQRCQDPDCRSLNYKSQASPIPPQVVCPLLGDLFEEEEQTMAPAAISDAELQQRLTAVDMLPDDALLDIDVDALAAQ